MANNVKVSIITPIYNTKPRYLKECIESVLAQTFKDFEFLFCDDGSKPYIKRIIDKYASDERIVYYKNDKNLGAAESRNKLIKVAKGKYLALLDSDDTMHPERLQKQVDFLEKHQSVGLLASLATENNKHLISSKIFNDSCELIDQEIFAGNVICNSTVMLRKSELDRYKVKYKNEFVPAEDYALYLDLVYLTQFAMLPEVLCNYRSYASNISHRQSKLQKYQAAMAQLNCIEKYTGAVFLDKDVLADFSAWNLPKKADNLINAVNHARAELKAKSGREDDCLSAHR